jgi:hypothetical protein
MRKMRVPAYCDDCLREKNCFVKVGLEGLKIVDCTNKISNAPQNIVEAGDTAHNSRVTFAFGTLPERNVVTRRTL